MNSKTIFIIDDDVNLSHLMLANLREAGYEARIAQDGISALQQLELFTPDLILLDVMMPGLDDFELCRRLKASPRTQEIPVIFMTALEDKVRAC